MPAKNEALAWSDVLSEEKEKPYFKAIMQQLEQFRSAGKIIYPAQQNIFTAFKLTAFEHVKVVILGQDPYHGAGQAHGLSFSVLPGVAPPPSLVNIYKELESDISGFERPQHGYLASWAEQGVLLLNTVLTVEAGKAHSHAKIGWEIFTDKVIQVINDHLSGVVFLLWGSHAQKKGERIDNKKHHILTAAHPSPLSAHRGFLGCRHFSKTNAFITKQGSAEIDWTPKLP